VIDTFNGIVVKDLVTAGVVQADISFTKDEMLKIYDRMVESNVLKHMNIEGRRNCKTIPYSEYNWRIRLNGQVIEIHWSEENCVHTQA